MNILLKLAFLFFTGSCIGWVIELLFRRFISTANKERKWINPGLLIGPYLPLYGFGLCALYLLSSLDVFFRADEGLIYKIILFVVMALSMTLIEYLAGVIFIKGMKVKLWDYSDEWGNIQGIICPRFSLIWAALGAVYYFFIHPVVIKSLDWLENNLTFSFVIGFFFGIFIVDTIYSCNILSKIRSFAIESEIVVKYEKLRSQIRKSTEESKKKARFFFSFRSEKLLSEHLRKYLENVKKMAGEVNTTLEKKIKIRKNKKH